MLNSKEGNIPIQDKKNKVFDKNNNYQISYNDIHENSCERTRSD
jgi:hypothetical protein